MTIEYLPRAVAIEREVREEQRVVEPRLMTVQPDVLVEQEVRWNSPFTPAWLAETVAWLRPEELDNPNWLRYTEDFSQTSEWIAQGGGIIGSTTETDPNGGNVAALLSTTGTPGAIRSNGSVSLDGATEFTFSVWLRRGPNWGGGNTTLRMYDGFTFFGSDATQVTDSWARYSVTGTTATSPTYVRAYVSPDSQFGVGDVYAAFPQVEVGSTATTYVSNGATAGGLVSSWGDFTQGSQAAMPLVVANALDGHSAALFDGVDDFMYYFTSGTGDDYEIVGSYEIHYVLRERSPAVNYVLFGGDAATERPVFISTAGAVWAHTADGASSATTSGVIADDTDYLVSLRRDASNDLTCWVNGVDVTQAGSASGSTWLRSLGRRSTEFYSGTLCEALLMRPSPGDTDRARVFAHFASRYPTLGVVVP